MLVLPPLSEEILAHKKSPHRFIWTKEELECVSLKNLLSWREKQD